MNWQNVIEYGKLIYRSNGTDEPFCNWSVKKIKCDVSYYEVYPLDDIDVIVCSILSDNDGGMDEEEMATILGFNVKDDFDMSPKRYKDVAELELFRGIIKPVYQWGLIEKDEGSSLISLTELGKRAFERKEKYKFLSGSKTLLENWRINADSDDDSIFFPYYQEFGVYTEIQASISIDYKKIDVSLFDALDTDLIRRLKLQSNKDYHIFAADETPNFSIGSIKVDLGLYQFENQYYPIIFYQDNICHLATDILNNDVNISLKDKKIEWGLYLRLMNDPMAVLDYKTLLPFEDIIEIDDLISDKRLAWSDDELFRLITSRSDANQHTAISTYCPIEVIKKHLLSSESTNWDWIVLSKRIDEEFILDNPLFQWDFEIISSREDVSIDTIKTLLLIPDLKDTEWNWDNIMPKLDFQFIRDNIENIDFDLYNLTETNNEPIQFLVSHYPSKRWNWNYVSTKYDLDFILNNITNFLYVENGKTDNKLNLKTIIDRAFTNSDYAEKYSYSDSFRTAILSCKDSLSYLSVNQSNYHWTDAVISFLENTGLLEWQSGTYIDGFECNPFVEWNKNYFAKYSHNVTTEKGFSFVSKSVKNPQIVIDNKDFKWNWLDLSENENLISDESFVKQCLESFALEVLLPKLDCMLIERLFNENGLKNLLIDDHQLWHIVTQKVSVDFVRNNIGYNWDWSVLTQRFYSSLKLDAIGNEKWVDKWDWNFLTSNLDKTFILNNLEKFVVYWDWNCLTRRFDVNELTDLLSQYKSDIFKWNYEYFYSLNFDIDAYLIKHFEDVNWDVLSSSEHLNRYLKWDNKIFNEQVWIRNIISLLENENYKWNFKKLSLLTSINSNPNILGIKTQEWDWNYLTEYSSKEFLTNHFWEFKQFINFGVLSKRTDGVIYQKLIEKNIRCDWDWYALTNNNSIKFKPFFIQEHNDKNWDWQSLSSRTDIEIDNTFLFELLNKDWNWQEISKRNDIVFDESCIEKLKSKPLDWIAVSRKNSFVPNQKTLSWLKGEKLDWDAISQNTNLDTSVLYDYKDLLNWKFVTKWIPTETKDLEKFKDYLDWSEINSRKDFIITNEILDTFADYIDWNKASQSKCINFTEELIEKYRNKWNWRHLRNNPVVIDRLENSLSKYKAEINCARFLERFPPTPCIYHFTHLFNAVEIIKSRKIMSRNKAEGKFANAAGNLVDRRSTAHNFARFYYRPQTPTQFYNECLGMDAESGYWKEWRYWDGEWISNRKWQTYYPQACKLGLPKCPMPVFFKFDLEEVISKMQDKCYYSTGNMQTNWANVLKITNEPNGLNTKYVYSTIEDGLEYYKEFSQQEFLVLDEFDFSDLQSFEIICFDGAQAKILKNQLVGDKIVDKITIDGRFEVFHRNNRQIQISDKGDVIAISANYRGDAHFVFKCSDKSIINTQHTKVLKETVDTISVYPQIVFAKTDLPVEVHFVDEMNRDWMVYRQNIVEDSFDNKSSFLFREWESFPNCIKKLLYKNWLLFEFYRYPIYVFLWDGTCGMDGLLEIELGIKADNNSICELEQVVNSNLNNITEEVITSIFDMEFIAMDSNITDLSCISVFENLKVLDFHSLQSSKIRDFSMIKNNVNVFDYDDYQIVDFSKQSNIDNIKNINYIKGYGWQTSVDNVFKSLKTSFNSLIKYYCNKYNELEHLYNSKVRHYTIKQHTELVCAEYDKYFCYIDLPIDKILFKIFLTLHDIGKPIAENKGDRSMQHKFTTEIINKYDWSYYNYEVGNNSKQLMMCLSSSDCIGEYFQDKCAADRICEIISSFSEKTGLNIKDMWYLFMVYYQCDVAAYTADAGGLPYLEKLFEYDEENRKVFDANEHLLKMSTLYWQKYHELKKCIYDYKY